MSEHVLITGGAGFIGRAVTEELLKAGHQVRILDSLIEQVHGPAPSAIGGNPDAELVHADIRDGDALVAALDGIDSVIHLAAEVGVGQSMYAVERYTSANDVGTAVLFEKLIDRPVRRIVTASSMSIYGEGLYRNHAGDLVEDARRDPKDLAAQRWDPVDELGRPLEPVATPEWKRPDVTSIYALNKYVQERTTLIMSNAYGMEGVCLRLFNVYGTGQALSNPYTGALAIFASRLLNDEPPVIFEDGRQRRDFVHVSDVARAFVLALERPQTAGEVFNIGSGRDRSIAEVAQDLAISMEKEIAPKIVSKARVGDIRCCISEGQKSAEKLGFTPSMDFAQGLADFADWVATQTAEDRIDAAGAELERRGLV